MKKIVLILAALLVGAVGSFADRPSLDPKPLPPGPLLSKAPDFSSWQITFAYGPQEKDSSSAASPVNSAGSTVPKLLTVTKTAPQWHAVLIDMSGNKREVWFDGEARFLVGPKPTDILVVAAELPGYQNYLLDYGTGSDFPDMNWVSPQTYLGTQTGTNLWVFQKDPKGPMVWIDSTTHLPVQWQSGGETRTIQFLSAPTAQLVLPPNVEVLAEGTRRLKKMAGEEPGHL